MVRTPSQMVPLGMRAPHFELEEPATGRTVSLDDVAKGRALLVIFMCNHCPFVVHLREAIRDFARDHADAGLATVGINSNDAEAYPSDSPEAMAREVEEVGYGFPYLFDPTQEVAKAYGAACTPDFFLFDADLNLVYRGQFDDSRPSNGVPITGRDLLEAVEATIAGDRPDPEGQVPSLGCNIKWKPGNAPEWFG